ncbi:hypothetical protein [Spongiactinospora sp. 9N601]|uniref:hypothetical protein n=1 Tax=Spongiactinospora sp. 9N601 TaxID=3375149 RepID=UPI00378A1AF3
MSTYLVFGATGHVGRRVAERLARGGAAVRAKLIGEAIGRRLRWQEPSPAQERARLLADPDFPDGFVEELLAGCATMAAAPPAAVTSTVRDITGAPATALSAWAAEHAADFGGGQR